MKILSELETSQGTGFSSPITTRFNLAPTNWQNIGIPSEYLGIGDNSFAGGNESFGSGLCRKNIETLLATVAQTQGFDDDEAITIATERTGRNDNARVSSSVAIQDVDELLVVRAPPEIDGDVMD
ncbi:Uncharacterized protein Fot_29957 [Forsythia ovata]|uniref:Uncharacterized protein n=1 Tax=Forsythia ovata TaxID=205694 RepID=A0ABD1TTD3_9LAMI